MQVLYLRTASSHVYDVADCVPYQVRDARIDTVRRVPGKYIYPRTIVSNLVTNHCLWSILKFQPRLGAKFYRTCSRKIRHNWNSVTQDTVAVHGNFFLETRCRFSAVRQWASAKASRRSAQPQTHDAGNFSADAVLYHHHNDLLHVRSFRSIQQQQQQKPHFMHYHHHHHHRRHHFIYSIDYFKCTVPNGSSMSDPLATQEWSDKYEG